MGSGVVGFLLIVTVACIVANAVVAAADLARARFVMANSAAVGLAPWTVPWLGVLKAAGAAGLALGLAGLRPLGLAAAVGLVLFFVCAVVAHLRVRALGNIAVPVVFLALAAGAAAYFG